MKIKNTFTSGKMNKDVDERLIPNGEYRDALNVRIANSDGSDVGAIENSLSNVAKSSLDLGANPKTLGAVSDSESRRVYWFVKSDNGSYICEYIKDANSSSILMQETSSHGVLNFSHDIQSDILTDIDNNKKFLYFTDGVNPPRKIEIETARKYEVDGFNDDDINVIVKPPIYPPSISLKENVSTIKNNMRDKIISFSYRYKYKDGQYSAMSPFSEFAFGPKDFSYDYSTATNKGMVNKYASADISVNTGSNLVDSVQLLFKEADKSIVYVVETYSKSKNNWLDNEYQVVSFDNSKIYKTLNDSELYRLYDNVPKTAKTQEIIGNRLVYGNYTENYNLIDRLGQPYNLNMSLSYSSSDVVGSQPSPTVKTNVDYEVGIVYLDEYGRSTTVLTNENNNTHIPINRALLSNKLNVSIDKDCLAPSFAKHYRFYIKQSKSDYDIIVPVVFYRDTINGFVYIKIQGDDANKVKEGDFVIIKTDTIGLRSTSVEAKVLELEKKDKNFLEDSSYTGPIAQQSGVYMKLKENGFSLNSEDFNSYSSSSYNNPRNGINVRDKEVPAARFNGPYYYGDNDSDDITVTGTYSGGFYSRLTISIDNTGDGVSDFDTFRWSFDTFGEGTDSFGSNVAITPGTPILLDYGISVQFASNVGHSITDEWAVNCKSVLPAVDAFSPQISAYGIVAFSDSVDSEAITPSSTIEFYLKDYSEVQYTLEIDYAQYISNGYYDTIEEWFYREGRVQIEEDWVEGMVPVSGYPSPFDPSHWLFMRGTFDSDTGIFTATGLSTDPMHLVYQSLTSFNVDQPRSNNLFVDMKLNTLVKATGTDLVIETIAQETDSDVYYEIPRTYDIDNGLHLGGNGDIDQTAFSNAFISLPFYNAFTWGTGIESYKIKDGFVANKISISSRPLSTILDYKENKRTSSITYSNVYEQSTNYNGLNEFNLSTANYVDLDDEYGSIERIYSRDTNLVVFQQNKVSQLLYNKNVLYNADGTGNVSQTKQVFGQQVPYVGEYGISNSPQSFAFWGNRIYFADERRGNVYRLSNDGINNISDYGMTSWFNKRITTDSRIIGGYDPYNDQYVLSVYEPEITWGIGDVECVDVSSYVDDVALATAKELLDIGVLLDNPAANQVWISVRTGQTVYVKYDILVTADGQADYTYSETTPIEIVGGGIFNHNWSSLNYSGGIVEVTTYVCDTINGLYVPYNKIQEYVP